MAWRGPGRGRLRHRVRFLERGPQENDGGVVRTIAWIPLFDRRGELLPVTGGEEVQAARAAGVSQWTLVIQTHVRDAETQGLTTDHRVGELGPDNTVIRNFDIRSILDLAGDGRWLLLTLDLGKGDGK